MSEHLIIHNSSHIEEMPWTPLTYLSKRYTLAETVKRLVLFLRLFSFLRLSLFLSSARFSIFPRRAGPRNNVRKTARTRRTPASSALSTRATTQCT